jgi:ubiquinol-cytochrome c reductase cytochrome c subunit
MSRGKTRAVRGGAWRRAVLGFVALLCIGGAAALWAAPPRATAQESGRGLFASSCAACHGDDARGVAGTGPSLVGVGAAAADFYLSTGRMPLSNPSAEPQRGEPAFDAAQRKALVDYIASLGGPPIPQVKEGDEREGFAAFRGHCAGCHAITARGGVAPPGTAPALQQASATQIAEAVRVGPYLMPRFDEHQISDAQLNAIVAYVIAQRHPDDRGGWGIGNIGPVPEGMITWLLAVVVLLGVARALGERAT